MHFHSSTIQLCDVILLCFDLLNRDSFEKIKSCWSPRLGSRTIPIVLVGTHCDLLSGGKGDTISEKEGRELAKQIGARSYVECSALTQNNIKVLFDVAVQLSFFSHRRVKKDIAFKFSQQTGISQKERKRLSGGSPTVHSSRNKSGFFKSLR
ncbi:rac-like GTP-binding protein RAC9 [Octopus sinensis]|uniref:Rac-like GTP-binding protein RAC9 n=1 Tax=Octopus sinensis TaxID=2607531 RepID=A0A6P7TZP0_9MOLL|nr:rac-like GTP-binding protein RAC9 [Octopus sinensis]